MYIEEDSFINWGWEPYWARIRFVENPGMAFGIKIWGPYGKLILSLFRIVAVIFLIYFIRTLIRSKAPMGLLVSFSLILAGAIGNILDSAFYGLIFSASMEHTTNVAVAFPEGGGYASFLHGKVVDMFYFPMWEGHLPSWIPFFGGKYFKFFNPIFNVADVSISLGVISILPFQRSFFSNDTSKVKEKEVAKIEEEEAGIEKPSVAISNEENIQSDVIQENNISSAQDEPNTTPNEPSDNT